MKLQSKNGCWKYSDKVWNLPSEGEVGIIEDQASGKVLNILEEINGTEVILDDKTEPISDGQKWVRGKANAEHWYTLTNVKSGKVLTALNQASAMATAKKAPTVHPLLLILLS